VVAVSLLAAACSSSPSPFANTPGSTPAVSAAVTTALTTDVQDPDPDVFHQTQGIAVITSTYEGLLRYLPNSTTVEPALAQAWKVSGDGLTYTFTMRQGVMFHDGTLMDSMAAKTSFERRTAINAAPAYMLSAVAGYDTPDPLTFVIRLKHPVSAFADYLASPYGPKLESPMALTMHAGSDMGQTWLKTHDVGTGAFQIGEFVPGDHYLLQRFDNYWGPAPLLRQVKITIVTDLTTQQMQLQSGQLQMVLQGLSKQAQATIAADPKFSIVTFLAEVKAMLFVNPNKGIFADPGLRSALRSAIARQPFLDQVYGTSATLSAQMYPTGELPTGMAMDTPKYDPTVLAAKVASLSTKTVDLAYSTDDPRNQLDAQIVQMVLQTAGLTVTLRGTSAAQTADLPNHPDQAPDLLVTTVSPDSGSPDSWGRQFYYTPGGGNGIQNYLRASVPGGDALLDQGLTAIDRTVAQQSFAMAGDQYAASGDFITLVDVKDVLAVHMGYVNFIHQPPVVGTIRWGDVKLGP
jgi:peptide/nickel transport system substrate-binding protein